MQIHLQSSHNSESSTSSKLNPKDKSLRRPINSFMLFSQEERGKIHLENPHRDNRKCFENFRRKMVFIITIFNKNNINYVLNN